MAYRWISPLIAAVLLTSCNSGSSSDTDQALLSTKIREGRAILLQTYSGVSTADYDPAGAIAILDDACNDAVSFQDGLLGPDGWEYPGDIPAEYREALYSTKLACHLSVALSDESFSDFAMFVKQLDDANDCLGLGNCG
jgi:hypothetical protein